MAEAVLICGLPASGKTTEVKRYSKHMRLNRDKAGGKLASLIPKMTAALSRGEDVVLDNLFHTASSRKPFIEAAHSSGAEVKCVHVATKAEECQVNALNRMWERHKRIFFDPDELREVKTDPNMFPISVLFRYKKEWEKPSHSEGFSEIEKVVNDWQSIWFADYSEQAILFDFDDTLRCTKEGCKLRFPTHPDEVEILARRKEVLDSYAKDGWTFLGVSNQSGIAKGLVTEENAVRCFDQTIKLLGHDIDYKYCPHNVPPVKCYCRKPQSGMGVHFIHKYRLDPHRCIMVGDQTTDKTFSTRLGINYVDQKEFFS